MNASKVYLVQTDTTVGFSSNDDEKLSVLKQRPKTQKILQTVNSFKTLQRNTRVPKQHKKRIRNATHTTFIYPNLHSFRVVSSQSKYADFLNKVTQCYSTSANKTQNSFDASFAFSCADIVIETKEGFLETSASSMYKINKRKIKKIR